MKQKGYIQSDLNLGNTRYSGIGKLPNENKYRKIDIVKTTKESFPFTLLYFTGDYVQNITMRKKAKKQIVEKQKMENKKGHNGKRVRGKQTGKGKSITTSNHGDWP